MQSLSKEERQQLILEQVSDVRKVDMKSLSQKLAVSTDTIRRDIKELADQGLLKATRGGAIAHSPIPIHFRDREKYDVSGKQQIALKALSQLKDGQVVLFDGGTSTLAIAMNLPKELQITVVTNSFPVANVLEDHPNVEVIFAGGRLSKFGFNTSGPETMQAFESIRADICFLSIYSIHAEVGITTRHYEDALMKKTMVGTSKRIIGLATLNKMNTAEAFYICPVTDLDMLITDATDRQEELLLSFKKKGIEVI
ncbi:DeoR/GlpR family DNA-binding transcription regulator [Pedobacter sp. KR3-3]|uniref:DeoR/GlpR family DNA-binding transcription regulator n=1 Tax=Pedobacter albus TaxID=3113905 RepID=A0ABU7I5N6_9SPHI|nr:DeoR/GlpR family DNA-binding transcription regulator [Pedobacter sp. KR3-3]MEE1944689.1 DeoR/GlpR family DNA-binding transcription regulator [Pedobacter sp. KR3-3]